MPASTDPTLEIFRMLDDRSRWVVKEAVPVFTPHERVIEVGGRKVRVVVDVPRLHRIARQANRLERDRAVIPQLLLGHHKRTKDSRGNDLPGYREADQPDWAGFARNWRVGRWGPKRLPGLLVDFWYDRRHYAEAVKCPFRSVEYYPERDCIQAVALLKHKPFLDLGMVVYGPGEVTGYHYAMGASSMPLPTEKQDDHLALPAPPAGPGAVPPGGDDADYDKFCSYVDRHPTLKYVCGKYAAEAEDSGKGEGGDDDGMGDMDDDPVAPPKAPPKDKGAVPFSSRRKPVNYEADLEAAGRRANLAEAKRIVDVLHYRDNVNFTEEEKAEEVENLAGMTVRQRKRRVKEIRTKWDRAPVGDPKDAPAHYAHGDVRPERVDYEDDTPEVIDRLVREAERLKKPFDEVYEAYRAGKSKGRRR